MVVLLAYGEAKVYLKAVLLKVSSETSTKVYISKSAKVFILESIQQFTGCPPKKQKLFVLKTDQSIKLVSFIRQILKLDFDAQFVKIEQKLTGL